MSKIISFDCDGVLLDTSGFSIGWMEKEFEGLHIGEGDVSCWEFSQAFGLTKDLYARFWKEFYSYPLSPIHPAMEVVWALRERGYTPVVATARNGEELSGVLPMLLDPTIWNFSKEEIYSCKAGDKPEMLDNLGALAHVDDKWQTASDLGEIWMGTGKISYLFSRPWNRSLDLATQYKRINNYMEVLNDFQ